MEDWLFLPSSDEDHVCDVALSVFSGCSNHKLYILIQKTCVTNFKHVWF